MKKILISVFIGVFLLFIVPLSFAKSIVPDNDLESIYAQSGSITITFDDIDVKSKDLRTTSTDGLDWWTPKGERVHIILPPDTPSSEYISPWHCTGPLCHADYILEASPTSINSDYENNTEFDHSLFTSKGYIGYADVHVTGGQIRRSGTMSVQVYTPEDDPGFLPSTPFNYTNVLSRCRVEARLDNQRIESDLGIEMAIKLGTTSDLSGDQYLGRVYTGAVSATTNGRLTVYAHNNSLF